jgi:YVTN family beta-propeller protein
MKFPFLAVLLAGALLASGAYRVVKKYPVPGDGGWDYLTVDSAAHRLYVSHATQTQVLDLDAGSVVGSIPGKGVHGTALAPKVGRGFITNGGSASVTVFDTKTLSVIAEVPVGQKPDALLYDSATLRVYVNNAGSGTTSVIDPATAKVVGTVDIGGALEASASDGAGHIFTNIEDHNEVVKVDVQTLKVVERWKLAPCETPTALAIDRQNQRLFAGCRSGIMAVVDASNGRLVATAPIGARVDAAAFDPETRTIYLSNGDGTVNLFHQDSADKYSAVETITTQFGAKTMALDLKSKTLYLSTADYDAAEPGSNRRRVKPGTFGVLVVSK